MRAVEQERHIGECWLGARVERAVQVVAVAGPRLKVGEL